MLSSLPKLFLRVLSCGQMVPLLLSNAYRYHSNVCLMMSPRLSASFRGPDSLVLSLTQRWNFIPFASRCIRRPLA